MEERLFLYKFEWWGGRGYDVESLFIATETEVNDIIGKEVYFGEICGKHSEVSGTVEADEITKLDVSHSAVKELLKANDDNRTLSGNNPIDYYDDEEDEDDEDEGEE